MKLLREDEVDLSLIRYVPIHTADEFRKVWKKLQVAHLVRHYGCNSCVAALKAVGLRPEHFPYRVASVTMQAVGYLEAYGVIGRPNVGAPVCVIPSKLAKFMTEFEDLVYDEVSITTVEVASGYNAGDTYSEPVLNFFYDAEQSGLAHIIGAARVRIPCSFTHDVSDLKTRHASWVRETKLHYYNTIRQFGF